MAFRDFFFANSPFKVADVMILAEKAFLSLLLIALRALVKETPLRTGIAPRKRLLVLRLIRT